MTSEATGRGFGELDEADRALIARLGEYLVRQYEQWVNNQDEANPPKYMHLLLGAHAFHAQIVLDVARRMAAEAADAAEGVSAQDVSDVIRSTAASQFVDAMARGDDAVVGGTS